MSFDFLFFSTRVVILSNFVMGDEMSMNIGGGRKLIPFARSAPWAPRKLENEFAIDV